MRFVILGRYFKSRGTTACNGALSTISIETSDNNEKPCEIGGSLPRGQGTTKLAAPWHLTAKNLASTAASPLSKIADGVEVDVALKARKVSGPPVGFKEWSKARNWRVQHFGTALATVAVFCGFLARNL